METVKKQVVSECCESTVHCIPASLHSPAFLFCSNCSTECKTKFKEVVTHKEIQKGIYRPIDNKDGKH